MLAHCLLLCECAQWGWRPRGDPAFHTRHAANAGQACSKRQPQNQQPCNPQPTCMYAGLLSARPSSSPPKSLMATNGSPPAAGQVQAVTQRIRPNVWQQGQQQWV